MEFSPRWAGVILKWQWFRRGRGGNVTTDILSPLTDKWPLGIVAPGEAVVDAAVLEAGAVHRTVGPGHLQVETGEGHGQAGGDGVISIVAPAIKDWRGLPLPQ